MDSLGDELKRQEHYTHRAKRGLSARGGIEKAHGLHTNVLDDNEALLYI